MLKSSGRTSSVNRKVSWLDKKDGVDDQISDESDDKVFNDDDSDRII